MWSAMGIGALGTRQEWGWSDRGGRRWKDRISILGKLCISVYVHERGVWHHGGMYEIERVALRCDIQYPISLHFHVKMDVKEAMKRTPLIS